MGNLLVVDWDYFFPNPMESGDTSDERYWLFDWGHAESILMRDIIWSTRAPGFLKHGLELPGVSVPEGWWDRFNIADDAVVEVSDSNMYSGVAGNNTAFERVWLFDAHHDLYRVQTRKDYDTVIEKGAITCEDWMWFHKAAGSKLHWRWPQWHIGGQGVADHIPKWAKVDTARDDLEPLADIEFDVVSICRSGSWVPPWCDQEFERFYLSCPGEIVQVDDVDLIREFDPAESHRYAEQLKSMEAQARA
jgi:hypothetical protein